MGHRMERELLIQFTHGSKSHGQKGPDRPQSSSQEPHLWVERAAWGKGKEATAERRVERRRGGEGTGSTDQGRSTKCNVSSGFLPPSPELTLFPNILVPLYLGCSGCLLESWPLLCAEGCILLLGTVCKVKDYCVVFRSSASGLV
ncbi:hypothetical protein ISCGN_018091 [Ixodes scapularis]